MTSLSDADRLDGLAEIADRLALSDTSEEARTAAQRVTGGRFYVACVGQFKRGKSTLIDALLDDSILPTGVVPVTAIPTIVRFGSTRSARVRLKPHGPATSSATAPEWTAISVAGIAQYVSEEENPANVRGVLAVEVYAPSELLSDGMCLVDTPGLGSVFEGNTLATQAFVPQIDAAIIVIGADPPITGDELSLIADVSTRVPDLIFVLNKADRVSPEELRQASGFAQRVIRDRLGISTPRIYAISAAERLAHAADDRDWPSMVEALEQLGHIKAGDLARDSGRRTITRIADVLRASIREELAALRRSQREASEHISALERLVADGERMLQDLGALFAAEQRRLSAHFADRRRHFLAQQTLTARELLVERLAEEHGLYGPGLRRRMMRAAQVIAEETLAPWMAAEQEEAQQVFRAAMTRFLEMAQSLVDRLAASGVDEIAVLRTAIGPDVVDLDARSRFVFNSVIHVAEPASPLRFGADIVLGLVAKSSLRRDAIVFLDWLLEMNSSRVQSDVEQRVDEGRQRIEQRVRRQLTSAHARGRELAIRAEQFHAEGAAAVESRIRFLDDTRATITATLETATSAS